MKRKISFIIMLFWIFSNNFTFIKYKKFNSFTKLLNKKNLKKIFENINFSIIFIKYILLKLNYLIFFI